MRIPWAWRSGPGQRGPESPADPPARGSGDPQHPEGASRQSQPRGFRRTERRCKLVGGAGLRARPQRARGRASAVRQRLPLPPRGGIPASPTPGVPKDRAALQTGGWRDPRPVCNGLWTCAEGTRIPGRPAAAHGRADRGQESPAHAGTAAGTEAPRTAAALGRRGAARPSAGLGRATEAHPTTPAGHPRKSHPGGSKGPSGIAIGRVAGCASRVQRARARAWDARRRQTLPSPRGVPDSPTPGVPKHRAALQTSGGRDARPVGMALGT